MPSVAAGRADVAAFFRRQEGEERERKPAKRRDGGDREGNNASRFHRLVIFVKIVAHFKFLHRVQIMIRVEERHVVDQFLVDVINALVELVVEEVKGVVAEVDRRGVAAHRFAVAARVLDAFVKDAERVDRLRVATKEEGADDRKNGGDGEEPPTFVRGRGGGGARNADRRRVGGRFDGRRFVLSVDFVGGSVAVLPKREAFYLEHRRNAERLAAFAGERLAGLRRFDRELTIATRTG